LLENRPGKKEVKVLVFSENTIGSTETLTVNRKLLKTKVFCNTARYYSSLNSDFSILAIGNKINNALTITRKTIRYLGIFLKKIKP
jgi:hypothetical protein